MTTNRTAYTQGLRALADALDHNPDLPLPYHGNDVTMSVFTRSKKDLLAYRALLGKVEKQVTDDGVYDFQIRGALHGLSFLVYAPRAEVCTRVVTGTKTVTREVPDADALAAVPTSTVTETVETVRWDCHPLLADEPATT